MAAGRGCLKPVLLGCSTLLVIFILFVGISALIAWNSIDKPEADGMEMIAGTGQVVDQTASGRGRVILNLAQGEFEIRPAAPGDGISIETRYDTKVYELKDHLIAEGDQWEYRVDFRRTMPALQALFRSLMTKGGNTYFRVYLPLDVQLDLEIHAEQGGLVAELGGLWLNEADISLRQGGLVLNIDRPLKVPMARLAIEGAMGGFELSNLGNASPAVLDIRHRMGGANIDLSGAWRQNSDIRIGVRMGGTSVGIPPGVETVGVPELGRGLRSGESEVPLPVLRFSVDQSMGQVDFVRR